jgi:cyclophilin family peptidyl-prolyl cis-trans isomerase/HEAT repeat protein
MKTSLLRPAASLAALLAVCACASGPRARTAPELPSAGVPNLEERALLLLLVDRQAYDEFVVHQALRGDASLREDLAMALGRIPDRQGLSALQGLLVDDQPAVRRAAAFSIGLLGDPEGQQALFAAVRDKDRETGVLAVEALGRLGGRTVDVLEALLPLPEEERWARLLPHLFRFKDDTVVSLAERGLKTPDPALHAAAAFALAREPKAQALPTLRMLLADPSPRVRAWAARALGIAGGEEDLAALRPLLDETNPAAGDPGPLIQALRSARALAAGKAKPIAGWTPRLRALLDDPRPGVRASAVEAAGVWGSPELYDVLAARTSTGDVGERGTALVALAAGKAPRALELVTAAAGDKEDALRTRAAEAAGALGLPAAAGVIERLAGDPKPRVRAAALAAWLTADPKASDPKAVGAARKALTDPDATVRGTVLDWLAEHPVVPLADIGAALPGVYQEATQEEGLAALRAVAARTEGEPLERGEGIALLERLATGGPYVLRRAAGESLGKLGGKVPALEPAERVKDVALYREIVQRTRSPRTVEIRTPRGTVTVRLACPLAPLTCLNFLNLAGQGFFDGLSFHRVVPDFVVQGGDPKGDGSGGPGYAIRDEINRLRYDRGVVGMALAGADTGGSQFFITLSPQPHLDGGYTAFGEVIAGAEVLDRIQLGDRIEKVVEVR